MAFVKYGNASGSSNTTSQPITMTMTTGIAINAGAIITKAVGDPNVALMVATTEAASTSFTVIPPFAVSNHKVATTATEVSVSLIQAGDCYVADITEILNDTTLTATGGGATTFVDSSLLGFSDNALIGSKWKVVTMASGDKAPGTILTCTDNTQSSGTITFASLGSTGFASGDTAKLVSVHNDYVAGQLGFTLSATADSITLDGALVSAQSAVFLRCIGATASGALGGSKDGNKLIVVFLSGCDAIRHTT